MIVLQNRNKYNAKMEIKEEILDKILYDNKIFAAVLLKINSGTGKGIKAGTFTQRLRRKSEHVLRDAAIIEYFKDCGYTNEEIFKQEKIKN